jgi:para-nitrobenzyl esterase
MNSQLSSQVGGPKVRLTQNLHRGFYLRLVLIIATVAGIDALKPAISAAAAPVISTSNGAVAGIQSASMNEYLGIPYATPPVGPLRWTPPQPHSSWKGVLQATQFGNKCPQFDFTIGKIIDNEDCVYLNVYTPRNQGQNGQGQNEGENLPVMVWIHGGAYTSGSGDPYDPTRLVAKGVIVVTINYRLGLLGFFAHPAIDAEGHLNGNYGLMDQQLALKWVKRNIGAFGGDPARVTIFGQSAGGHSVYAHLASPLSKGLFQRAIAESGAYVQFQDYFGFVMPLAAAETTGLLPLVPSGILEAGLVNCGGDSSAATAACLRAVPAASFVNIAPSTLYAIIDGTLLPQSPTAAIGSGQFNRVPVMTGSNHDEYRSFIADDYDFQGNPLSNSGYQAALEAFFGTALGDSLFFNVYPLPSSPPADAASLALSTALTDDVFACPERNSVRLLSKFVKTYAYEFNDENAPPTQDFFGGFLTFPLGAYHTAELQFLFIGDFFGFPVLPLSADEQSLSDAMVSYWTRFGTTGNPNSPSTPLWAPYHASTDQFQSLTPPIPGVESTFASEHLCSAFWNTF